jgi:pyruvate,water dikinase
MSARALLFTLCLAAVSAPAAMGCAAESSEEEEPELSADELSTRLELLSIKSASTYASMGVEGGGFGQAGRSMKFFVDARDPAKKKVHFINGNYKVNGVQPDYAKYHYNFAQHQLHIPEGNTEFNDNTYFSDDKRYYAGTIQTYQLAEGQPPIYAVQLYPDDVAHEGGILELVKAISAVFKIPGARMAFIAGGPQQSFATVKPQLQALGYEALTIEAVLGSVKYLPLNPGEAWGYLRIFPTDQGNVRPTDILVFDELPLDLTVCAGTITKVFQDVTSHVNLKSKERGTPNMVFRDASPTNGQLAPFKDKPVHLVVGKSGFTIEATTAAIVEQKLKDRTNKPWIPLPVTNEPNLVWYDDMCKTLGPSCTKNGARFGGKAANLGFLANRDVLGRKNQPGSQSAKAGYDITPQGFAIPISYYRDFLALPDNAALKTKLDALIAKEKGGNLSPNDRKALSLEVQQLFYAAKVPPAQLAGIVAQVTKLKTLVPDVEKLKLRSSANAEDIPNFDGAGLHDSFSVKLSSTDRPDMSCTREESQDGVVTKVDMKPKTVQCALKGVYASLWNTRAIDERSFARIDHASAAMGLAVVPAYDTESEVAANGVVITRAVNSDFLAYTLGLQKDNNLVTNPEPGTIAQSTLATFGGIDRPTRFTTTRFAKPTAASAPLTSSVMTEPQMANVVDLVKAVEVAYCRAKEGYYPGDCKYVWLDETKPRSLDLEFKFLQNGQFVVKQMREFHGD